jgi:hypothetical protein
VSLILLQFLLCRTLEITWEYLQGGERWLNTSSHGPNSNKKRRNTSLSSGRGIGLLHCDEKGKGFIMIYVKFAGCCHSYYFNLFKGRHCVILVCQMLLWILNICCKQNQIQKIKREKECFFSAQCIRNHIFIISTMFD